MVSSKRYEQALERAQNEHLQVVYLEIVDGAVTAHIRNPQTQAEGEYYTVTLGKGAHVMQCNCYAGQQGAYCKHRAFLRVTLVLRKTSLKPSQPIVSAAEVDATFEAMMAPLRAMAQHNFETGRGSGSWH